MRTCLLWLERVFGADGSWGWFSIGGGWGRGGEGGDVRCLGGEWVVRCVEKRGLECCDGSGRDRDGA